MDRVTRGWVAGTIGCMAKSLVNAASNRLGLMGMRNSTVGTDLVLGKTLMKRKGITQWLVGEIASSQLGGIWGTVMALAYPAPDSRTWAVRGVQIGSVAWMIDMALGARAIPRAVQGDVSPNDALMWYVQHLVFGLVAAYVLDGNPDVEQDIARSLRRLRGLKAQLPAQATTATGAQTSVTPAVDGARP